MKLLTAGRGESDEDAFRQEPRGLYPCPEGEAFEARVAFKRKYTRICVEGRVEEHSEKKHPQYTRPSLVCCESSALDYAATDVSNSSSSCYSSPMASFVLTDSSQLTALKIPRLWWVLGGVGTALLVIVIIVLAVTLSGSAITLEGDEVLDVVPLIDGTSRMIRYGTVPAASRTSLNCEREKLELRCGCSRLQFWVAYVSCNSQYKDAVEQTLEQIDVIKRLIKAYPNDLQFADSSEGIWNAFNAGKIASLIAVEGGHSIDSRLAVLRIMAEAGGSVRKQKSRMGVLQFEVEVKWHALMLPEGEHESKFQHVPTNWSHRLVVKELNRLGVMVDLSHVSKQVMIDAINESRAPIIFSHSSAWSICNHHRNVQDDVLRMVTQNNGVVMVNFYSGFVSCSEANATLDIVVDHINHIRNVAGVDHVGIGADYDGVSRMPTGLENVSKYPDLFNRLANTKAGEPTWTAEDLKKLAGLNLLRVFKDVEKVRDSLAASGELPYEDLLPETSLGNNTECRTDL
uniref:Dipeptidase n=1 Tax=Timema douglasi TaxID=61478 RepID=A0A7R8Z974_TIMDO|nr:unnamed protein product [Timema douglasi]